MLTELEAQGLGMYIVSRRSNAPEYGDLYTAKNLLRVLSTPLPEIVYALI